MNYYKVDKSHQAHTWRRGFSPLLCTDFRSFISQCCVQAPAPSSASAVYRRPFLHQPVHTPSIAFRHLTPGRMSLTSAWSLQPVLCTGACSFVRSSPTPPHRDSACGRTCDYVKILCTTVQLVRHLPARECLHAVHAVSRNFSGAAFETVLMLIGLTMGLSPPVKQHRPALSLSVPLSSR